MRVPGRRKAPGRAVTTLPPSTGGLSRSRRWAGLLLALAGTPALTVVLVAVRGRVGLDSVLLSYLVVVVVVAVVGGLRASVVGAVAAFLLANYFLTPPYYTLQVESRDRVVQLVVFVVVAVLVSVTVDLGARDRASAERHRVEALLLARLTTSEIGAGSAEGALEQVRSLFALTRVELVDPPDRGGGVLVSTGGDEGGGGRPALVVVTDSGLVLHGYGPERFAEDGRLLRSLAESAARAWQEQRLADEAGRAAQLAETDRVRAALLAAVGHDLRTPLAGIKAAVSTLRQPDVAWSEEQRAELLASIEESTDRLTRLIGNLLAISRIQAGAVSVHLAAVSVDEVAGRAVLSTDHHDVRLDVPEDLPLVLADAGLLERVLANLLENAARVSPRGEPVALSAGPSGDGRVAVLVVDHGPGVPPAQWEQMFRPYQRLGDQHTGGSGLGLAIARGFSDAMDATVAPERTPGGGLTMRVTLPVAP